MAFMTPAEIKAVRLQGSKVVMLEGLNKEVRIIKMAAEAQLKSTELQADVRSGKRQRTDTILFMFEHALADLDGTPLTAEDASQVLKLLSLGAATQLVNDIAALIGDGVKVEASGSPEVELTPAAKKD